MSIVADDSTTEIRYYIRNIELQDVAPILLERNYSHGGKEFLPDSASARWNHGDPIKDISVGGYVLKRDRTTGQQRTTIDYVTPASIGWNTKWNTNAPEWLLELFADK